MLFIGCDLGSTTGKVVIMDESEKILGSSIVRSSRGPKKTMEHALAEAMQKAGINEVDRATGFPKDAYVVATGYGRGSVENINEEISEISCHARGATYLRPTTRTIIDIGGQDCKVISVDETGRVLEFQMNDKCSAGTGRFFEVMGRVLDLSLEDLAAEALKSDKPCAISKQCSVFAESEVVSLIAQNKATDDIVHGLNKAVASKTAALAKRVGGEERYMMTGGVSKNQGLVKTLEEKLGTTLVISDKAQLCGALGAALFAKDMVTE